MNTDELRETWRQILLTAELDNQAAHQLAAILRARDILMKAGLDLIAINTMAHKHYRDMVSLGLAA